MPQCCSVPLCSNKTGGHKFPTKDKTRLRQWLLAIRRDKFAPTQHSIVCKSHFTADDYELPKDSVLEKPRPVLKKSAVPSKFPWSEHLSLNQKLEDRIRRRLARNEQRNCVQNQLEKDTLAVETTNHCKVKMELEFDNKQKDIGIQCDLCECNLQKRHPKEGEENHSPIVNKLDNTKSSNTDNFVTIVLTPLNG